MNIRMLTACRHKLRKLSQPSIWESLFIHPIHNTQIYQTILLCQCIINILWHLLLNPIRNQQLAKHATRTLIAKNITTSINSLHQILAIIHSRIRTCAKNTCNTRLSAQQTTRCAQHIRCHKSRFRSNNTHQQTLKYPIFLRICTTRTIKINIFDTIRLYFWQ